MCGIAGFFTREPVAPHTAARMLDALKQRGPDAQHITGWNADFHLNGAETDAHHNAMLHARLSIIDPRPISDQPMVNDDGSVWICYNGEVYDWAAHAEELRAGGARFRTRSDTEFILRAYEAWGMDMLPRLRGMFAIVILDLRQRKLIVVRDRMGLKPLVYAHLDGNFAYGSTVRSLLPFLPQDKREFDADAIDAYLAHRYVPAPMTIFSSLRRLENAHYLTFDLSTRELTKTCYWQPQPSDADWRATLDAAVSMRTVADRPLGLFLSSGIDSSLVASRLAETGHAGLQTFTAGFSEPDMDESGTAAEIARALGFPNRVVPIASRVRDDLDRIVADLDEPFADPSCVPTWYLARETTQHVKVVLGGDGGDEMFAGYKRFDKHLRKSWTRGWHSGNKLPRSVSGRAALRGKGIRKFLDEFNLEWSAAYSLRFSGMTPSQRVALQPSRMPNRSIYWRMPVLQHLDPLRAMLEIDRLNYLPEYILRKGDLCTMAHGLELRAPLLDHHWVNVVTGLPDAKRFTQPRKLFVDDAMPTLRPMKLFERKKRGFNPPLTAWLRDDLADRLAGLGSRLQGVTLGQIEAQPVEELVSLYRHGESHLAEQVLQLLVLDISLTQLAGLAAIP